MEPVYYAGFANASDLKETVNAAGTSEPSDTAEAERTVHQCDIVDAARRSKPGERPQGEAAAN